MLFQGGKLASMMFAILFVVCLYLVLGRWSGIARIKGKRTLDGVAMDSIVKAGTIITVQMDTEIPGVWPIPYVLAKDRLLRRDGTELLFEASFVPDWRRRSSIQYRTTPMRRGYYHFGRTSYQTEDVFGIFKHEGNLELPASFGVTPHTIRINEWKQYHRLIKGLHQHSATTRAMRETTQLNGVREYHHGDRLSRIHWNATARTGQFKSKEFEKEALPKSVLVLDRSRMVYKTEQQFELAVSITASLLEFASQRDLAVGLLSVGEKTVFFEPSYSAAQYRTMLHHLIDVEADSPHSIESVLQGYVNGFSAGTLLVFITPQYQEPIDRLMDWIEAYQMTPCHMWISSAAPLKDVKLWSHSLKLRGITGYALSDLEDLPRNLEVRS